MRLFERPSLYRVQIAKVNIRILLWISTTWTQLKKLSRLLASQSIRWRRFSKRLKNAMWYAPIATELERTPTGLDTDTDSMLQ